MIKTPSKVRTEGAYLNIMKAIHNKPTASIIPNRQKLQVFPLRLETRQGCLLSPLFLNIVLEVQDTAIGQEDETKHIQIRRKNETVLICKRD